MTWTDRTYGTAKRFCVVYRRGGSNNFTWHRSLAMTMAEALTSSEGTNRMGYLAHVEDYDRSVRLGLPETYDAQHPVAMHGPRDGDRPSPFLKPCAVVGANTDLPV